MPARAAAKSRSKQGGSAESTRHSASDGSGQLVESVEKTFLPFPQRINAVGCGVNFLNDDFRIDI